MKESTEQKIREYLEQFRIKFTGEEKKRETVTLDDFITLYDDSSESSCFSCLSSDKNIHGCETVSDKIAEDICNIIEKDDKVSFYSKSQAKNLDYNQKVICRCPNWNDEGYQIATWNGEEFEFSAQPNNMFDEKVIAFCPIDDDGIPFSL